MASTQPELYKALLQALIQARKDAGITQVELAARIGRRQTFVSKYETEERRLDVAEYIAIARAMKVEPFELMREPERAHALTTVEWKIPANELTQRRRR